MSGDVQVRFCESLRVRLLRATRLLILCRTKRQLHRCKQRMMVVLKERSLSLSRKKTRIGRIDRGFHFLGIHYPGTQTSDNTNVTQAHEKSVIHVNSVHYLASLGGGWGRQMLLLIIKILRLIASFRIQERCVKHANKSINWSWMGHLPKGSKVTCIAGPCGG